MLLGLIAALLAVAAWSGGCSDDEGPKRFVFTPAAYEYLDGTDPPIPYYEVDGEKYQADLIAVEVRTAELDELVDWAHSYGFTIEFIPDNPRRDDVAISVGVPAGSAPAAITLFRSQKGVIGASPAPIFEIVD
jgi:hypothetical protein